MIWKRKTPRLSEYDYSQAGAYFVTVCVQDRQGLLGTILNGEMQLNPAGLMVEKWWKKLESNFTTIRTDFYVVMPNHFHGIVIISEPPGASEGGHMGPPLQKIMQWFKTMSTNEYIHGVKEHAWKPFRGQPVGRESEAHPAFAAWQRL